MKTLMRKSIVLFTIFLTYSTLTNAQFWSEDFGDFNTTPSSVANGYMGLSGTWIETQLAGNTGAEANKFFVSCSEAGMLANNCGSACPIGPVPNPSPFLVQSLHIGSVPSVFAIACPNGDCGATYNAGDGGIGLVDATTDVRVESPNINCTGQNNIVLTFNYIENGDNANDNAEVWYYDGSVWVLLLDLNKTNCGNVSGGPCNTVPCSSTPAFGIWTTTPNIALPASANNNPNVKIGFRWTNNNDGVGTDPSFAIADVKLTNNGLVGIKELNNDNTIVISPNPIIDEAKISVISETNSRVEIQLYNQIGQMIYFDNINFTVGINTYYLNLDHILAGNYTLKIVSNEINSVNHIVKK